MGVERRALKTLDSRNVRQRRRRQHADRGDQEAGRAVPTVFQGDVPTARALAVVRGGDAALELDVAAQIELVGDVVQIAFGLGLAGKMLLPVPLVEQLLRERVAVGPAFGIEPGARVAVPVPSAAYAGAGFKYPHREAEFPQFVELVKA
jgi:hypothetical protein